MPAPQNNQGFVQPEAGGTGSWISKIAKKFGGAADDKRSRSAAQLQLDLHAGKADVDTFHKKDRMNYQAAVGEYTANESYKRSGREIRRGIKVGPEMGVAGLLGFDSKGRPTMQRTGQRPNKSASTDGAPIINNNDTPPPPPPGAGTPPADRANNPARKAKPRKEAGQAGIVVDTAGTATKVGNDGKLPAKKNVTTPDSAATPTKVRKPRTPKADA